MKARQLIRDAAFDPTQLEMITGAFEEAWSMVKERFASDAARESARMRLATIILALASQGIMEPELLKASAVEAMIEPLN